MALERGFDPTLRPSSPTPRLDTFIAPALLPVCCCCGLIRDDRSCPPGLDCWLTQRTYRAAHGIDPDKITQTHTYCPECFTKVQEAVREYFRETGVRP